MEAAPAPRLPVARRPAGRQGRPPVQVRPEADRAGALRPASGPLGIVEPREETPRGRQPPVRGGRARPRRAWRLGAEARRPRGSPAGQSLKRYLGVSGRSSGAGAGGGVCVSLGGGGGGGGGVTVRSRRSGV